MALRDHFKPPLSIQRPWEGVHSAWAAMLAEHLNASQLPKEFVALPQVHRGSAVEIDVATLRESASTGTPTGDWTANLPTWTVPVDWNLRDLFEVRIVHVEGQPRLVAAIELISPANKDRPGHRRAFAGKCAGLLRQGVSVLIVDVVTERQESLHQEILDLLELNGAVRFDATLYTIAYRTVEETKRLEMWAEPLAVGSPLPTMPLWLTPELAVPVHLEEAYERACRSLRIQ